MQLTLFKTKDSVVLVGLSHQLPLWKVLISLRLENSSSLLNNNLLIVLVLLVMKAVMEVLRFMLLSMLKNKVWNSNLLILTLPLMVIVNGLKLRLKLKLLSMLKFLKRVLLKLKQQSMSNQLVFQLRLIHLLSNFIQVES